MIDSISNLLFRCSHKRLTRPVSPVSRAGAPHKEAYVVCLDCGKQFAYDFKEMRMGKPLPVSHDSGVLAPDLNEPRPKLKYALWAGLAVLLGVALKGKKEVAASPRAKAGESAEKQNR